MCGKVRNYGVECKLRARARSARPRSNPSAPGHSPPAPYTPRYKAQPPTTPTLPAAQPQPDGLLRSIAGRAARGVCFGARGLLRRRAERACSRAARLRPTPYATRRSRNPMACCVSSQGACGSECALRCTGIASSARGARLTRNRADRSTPGCRLR